MGQRDGAEEAGSDCGPALTPGPARSQTEPQLVRPAHTIVQICRVYTGYIAERGSVEGAGGRPIRLRRLVNYLRACLAKC